MTMSSLPNDDDFLFADDDDVYIHSDTALAMNDFEFDGRRLEFVHAYSGEEARQVILDHPDAILNKPGKHTPEDWQVMKTHAMLGFEMLRSSNRRILRASALSARDHHEKWAGGGYPYNKRAEDIHLYGRITAVPDVFDALGNDRCYKEA